MYDAFGAPANPFLLARKRVEETTIVPDLVQAPSFFFRSPGQTGRWEVGEEDTVSVL